MWTWMIAAALAAGPEVEPAPDAEAIGRHTTADGRTVDVLHVQPPTYPRGEGVDAACTATVEVGADGRMASVDVRGCGRPFAEKTQEALAHWRWRPSDVGEQATIVLPFTFRVDRTADDAPRLDAPADAPDPIALVKTVPAELPDMAVRYGTGATFTCSVDITLKGNGAPRELVVTECPELFHDSVQKALKKWRWTRAAPDAPPLDGWTTTVTVGFRVP